MEMKIILDKSIENKTICTGFKGVGNVGQLSLNYLLKGAKAQKRIEKIGYIFSPTQPPFVEVTNDGIGNPYEFFEVNNTVFLNVRFPPLLKEQTKLAKNLTKKAKKEGAKGFLLLGGLDRRIAKQAYQQDPLPIAGVSNMKDPFLSRMKAARVPEGILISGGVALILSYANHLKIPSLALFSPAEKGETERESALRLAKKISNFLDLKLDFEAVKEEILLSKVAEEQRQELEDEMKEQTKERSYSDLFT